MAHLHLNLKGEYLDQIKASTKGVEYRLAQKWLHRLDGKTFDGIVLKRDYPKRGDSDSTIERP